MPVTDLQTKGRDCEYLILVEHAARELDIACLIKYYIEKEGGNAGILPLHYLNRAMLRGNRIKVLILPYCYSFDDYRSILGYFTNISIVNLTYEQLYANVTENAKTPKDEFVKQFVLHHSWSEKFHNFLTTNGVNPKNIFTNGNLSLALYRQPYRTFFKNKSELATTYHLDTRKKWLFIPENFAAAFFSRDECRNRIRQGAAPYDIYQYQEFAKKSLKKIILWLDKISNTDDIEIIFRPRPAISYKKMYNFFLCVIPKIPSNIHIIKEESVREWILACDIVMTSYSTTIIEAAVAEKPIAILAPYPIPPFLHVSWHDMVTKIQRYDDFSKEVFTASKDSFLKLKNWAETDILNTGDPIKRIADFIIRTKENGPRLPEDYYLNHKRKTYRDIKKEIFRSFCLLRQGIFRKKPFVFDYSENDHFTETETIRRFSQWEEILRGTQ